MCIRDRDGNLLGYVFNVVSHEGYGGDIAFSMGVTTDLSLIHIFHEQGAEDAGKLYYGQL